MEQDWKSEYLFNTFGKRGSNKQECYVINAVWQRLLAKGIELEPVAQQYVRRFDGHEHKYARIDLYFPAINVGIEVDEKYHIDNQVNDQAREKEVLRVLFDEMLVDSAKLSPQKKILAQDINEASTPELLRIKAYSGYKALTEQIEKVVQKISDRVDLMRKKNPQALIWQTPEEQHAAIAARGVIKAEDRTYFQTVREICACISPADVHNGNGSYSTSIVLKSAKERSMLWCPKLGIKDEFGEVKAVSDSGWVNVFLPDGRIKEWNDDPEKMAKNREKDWLPRPTFMRMRDVMGNSGYRFIGVYQRQRGDIMKPRIYERLSDRFEWSLKKVEEAKKLRLKK